MSTELENKPENPGNLGAFESSLIRTNKQIRKDRAEAITEDVELLYKRTIEDLRQKRKKLIRERENMLDLSPATADSLILASDFNAAAFIEKELNIGVDLRNLDIKIKIAEERYLFLFGKDISIPDGL